MFNDLPTSREVPSNIKAMSKEIGVQGLTALSTEPPRWETHPTTLLTNRPNVSTSSDDNEIETLPSVLDFSSRNKIVQSEPDSDDNKPLGWKLSRKGASSSGRGRATGYRVSSKYSLKEDLVKSKNGTKRRR